MLEFAWNFFPIISLTLIIGPSFALLYLIDDFFGTSHIVKVIGNQWFWGYEFFSLNKLFVNETLESVALGNQNVCLPTANILELIAFSSVFVNTEDIESSSEGGIFLLEVTTRLFLMYWVETCFYVTSNDVLHSWAIPSLGLKTDACPGRINRIALWPIRCGVFYGQCSEICGLNHAFMPISAVVLRSNFNVLLFNKRVVESREVYLESMFSKRQ